MAKDRSVDFLPEIFQTPTNKKFLKSTLDQLTQEPKLKQTQGYIGKVTGPSVDVNDTYLIEQTLDRANYQLEPGIVFKKDGKPDDALTYPGLIDGLAVKGSNVENHDRMFASDTYSWSPFIDFDKFVNYSQYYWLPSGPASVDVSATDVFLTNDFEIIRNAEQDSYSVGDFPGENPIITVVRGGSYEFNVNQTGNGFYIQSEPGVDGTLPWSPNISSRDVLGVVNNGEDNGTVTFNVPNSDAQTFYYNLTDIGNVDLATDLRFDEINHKFLSDITTINQIQDLNAKTIVFLNSVPGDANDLGWKFEEMYDGEDYDSTAFSATTFLDTQAERYSIFQISLEYDDLGENPYIRLFPIQEVNQNERFTIQYGEVYSNISFYKNASGYFEQIPITTASLSRLYYQDANNPDMFGVINVINQEDSATLFIEDIIGQVNYTSPNGIIFTNGLKVQFRGDVEPIEYANKEYYVEGVGESIQLLDVTLFVTPEPYTHTELEHFDTVGFDTVGYNGSSDAPLDLDYLTINRASQDLNAWTRSNRWFHIDVIEKTAEYNSTTAVLDNNFRAKRPIIEFEPNLRLFNYGTIAKQSINIIDFNTTDALSTVNGSTGHSIDGYDLVTGSRVVFAVDIDANVRNKIYTVELADMNNDGTDVINLTPADDAEADPNDIVLVTHGLSLAGTVYSFVDGEWAVSQAKTAVNQAPLFDIFDEDDISLSDLEVYSSTTFIGTKLFSYKEGIGLSDPVLGFPLTYLNIDNLGDIVFENNLYSDTFVYVDAVKSIEELIQDGFVRKYSSRIEFTNEIGWTNSADKAHVPQIFNFSYDGVSLLLDVYPKRDLETPAIKVVVANVFVTPSAYEITENEFSTVITFNTSYDEGTKMEVSIISDQTSAVGYYSVPVNLSSNVFNENTQQLTLGTIRNHYNNLAQNITAIEGQINGSNNIRDLGNVAKYGDIIVQNSSPVSLVSQFIRKNEYNFFDALKFNARNYERFKNQLLDWVYKHDTTDLIVDEILEQAVKEINAGKVIGSSFYQSDMLPTGTDYETTTHEVTAISTDTFNTINVYDFTKANYQALLVYVNDELKLKDDDYTVATTGPRVTFLINLEIGDQIVFKEYTSTIGSSVPNTPTKMGMYKKFRPALFEDNTYSTPINVIRGHDGSISPAFDDIRDDVLLEFENRIYNNLKVNDDIPLLATDVIPGQFRSTDYTDDEITEITSTSLLSWLGYNRIDYKNQDYRADEEKTWNYGKSGSKLDQSVLKGHWRGIYTFYYDTDAPHERPWEMLGLSEEPTWWVLRYGPAPYTSGNKVLWDDLEIGLIKEPDNERISEAHIRTGLSEVIPVSSEGVLLTPLENMVANYTAYDFKNNWKIGDQAPAENAFKRSSAWPFAVQRMLALTKPAQYFALMVDRDRYTYSADFDQYLYDGRQRIDSRNIEIQSNTTPKHSYINWIADYNTHYGYNSVDALGEEMANSEVNLCYRMASFTDKNNLKIFTDKSSPDSNKSTLLFPDESYSLLLYRNQPFNEVTYSAITVQQVDGGYSVTGNSITDPYFKINQSRQTGNYKKLTVGRTASSSTTVRIPLDFTDNVVFVPYGFVFNNRNLVVDFLASYGEYLKRQGLKFNNVEQAQEVNWNAMTREFIYWSDQGWENSSIINLNPSADTLEFERELTVVDSLLELAVTNQPQDQNKAPLDSKNYVIDRIENNFKIDVLNDKSLGYLNFTLTSFEHLLVLDNVSIFDDLMYDPVTGLRQQRVKIYGATTYDWTGQLDAPGFMLNEDNVKDWAVSESYNNGALVKYKNAYWSASENIQPSEEFDFDKWTKIDYNKITKGLIANAATKSKSMLSYYDNQTANLEQDADLLSLGLTGFRPRDYLSSLDLDDISQVNIYRDMIENKGTPGSLDLFRNADFNNELTNYEIFENWAVKRAEYGATSSRAYADFQLDETLHTSNPTIIEVVSDPADESIAAQKITLKQIYKESVKHNDINILPMLTEKVTDVNLPYAGFVDRDDVDIATFSLDDYTDINNELANIVDGTLVWVAKDTKYDWNVYRITAVEPELINVVDNLDGKLTLEFNRAHNLEVDDVVVIKYFDEQVDGTSKVLDVDSAVNIRIDGSLTDDQTVIEGNGVVFVLRSARVDVPSSIEATDYNNNLFLEDKVWVERDNAKAAVYEKILPFNPAGSLQSIDVLSNAEYGYAVAQGFDNYGAIVTDPVNNDIHCFNKSGSAGYLLNRTISVPNLTRLGNSASMSSAWSAVTANDGFTVVINRSKVNNTFREWQVISRSSAETESEVAISDDEHWMAIGEPSVNKVHMYQKIEHQDQFKIFEGDGTTNAFYIGDTIIVDTAEQLIVQINNVDLTPITDYNLDTGNVVIFSVPNPGVKIEIERKKREDVVSDGIEDEYTLDTLYTADGDNVSIFVDNVIQRPGVGNDYTTSGNVVTFTPAPAADASISFRTESYYEYADTIDGAVYGSVADDKFGANIDIAADGSEVIITAPGVKHDTLINPNTGVELVIGKVYTFDRVIERFVVTNETTATYQTRRNSGGIFQQVRVNGILLESNLNNNNPEYDINGVFVNINYPDIKVGDFLDVDINIFNLIQELSPDQYSETVDMNFGSAVTVCKSKCSIYVGADHDSHVVIEGGSVTRLVNEPRMYGVIVGDSVNPVITVGDTIRINRIDVAFTGTTVEQCAVDINNAITPNVSASTENGQLIIELINKRLESLANLLEVMPGEGTAYTDLGLEPYCCGQIITSPGNVAYGHFGNAVQINQNMNQLVVGASDGTARKLTSFDSRDTTFDGKTMRLVDSFNRSGVVFTYDLLRDETEFSAGKLVFGQQIYDVPVEPLSNFGHAVDLVDGILLVGSPGYDSPRKDSGRAVIFENEFNELSWQALRVEQDQVDVSLINAISLYDSETQLNKQYLDYIDPLNGKILGVAKQNLDYITTLDPATYQSSSQGILWGEAEVGELWWNVENVRFLDYHQKDINYANRLWGKVFPGSTVDVYQWIASDVPPVQYAGDGTPYNVNEYISLANVGRSGIIETTYYYWVKDISSISTNSDKTLSAVAVASYIEAPRSSGISYATLIKSNVIGLVNSTLLLNEKRTILHVEYDKIKNDNNVFVEYDLVRANNKTDFLSNGLYKKFQDSFCGVDSLGNLVPDVTLSPSEQYGVKFRPRQSMYQDRFKALQTYIDKVNALLLQHPIAESRVYPLLNSAEPEPAANTGAWDIRVQDNEELSFQNLDLVDPGYKILVQTDYSNNGLWTIYEVTSTKTLLLIRVQNFDTTRYWDFTDWYDTGFDEFTVADLVVESTAALQALSNPADNAVVKVTSNSVNKWELYVYTNSVWERVGLEGGTIQFNATLYDYSIGRFGFDVEVFDSQYFDQEPVIELRQIIKSINEELLIGDLQVERNKMLITMFQYVLSESTTVDWLNKTSLIDVNHNVRSLLPYSVYKKDNQDYVIDYINEAKPYHCKIKEFLLTYDGFDLMEGSVTDFDCPSYWNDAFSQFISPILDDGAILITDPSNTQPDDDIWTTQPWNAWYNNRGLDITEVVITNPGTGYTVPPLLTVVGESTVEAELVARINGAGQVKEIVIIESGSGYKTAPEIVFNGGNGIDAAATAVTSNNLVRSIKTTMKYDRYEYESTITDWVPENVLAVGDRVRYENKAYETTEANNDPTFVAGKYDLLDIETLSGVDRTTGFYVADVNNPGYDISLLMNGIAYPGVEVFGVGFSANTGYDSDLGFDVEPFDNVEIGPDGYETYSETLLDTRYESSYSDTYLGTRPTDINVDGGLYIDTYHSHAPEELVPGSIFDTLNMEVRSRPGSDYLNDGHGFALEGRIYQLTSVPETVSFDGMSEFPITVQVVNSTTGYSLYENTHYTTDWNTMEITLTSGVVVDDFVKVFVSSMGGGDQLYRNMILGDDVVNDRYVVTVGAADIDEVVVYSNGFRLTNVAVEPIDAYTSTLVFSDTFVDDAKIMITILGDSIHRENHYEVEKFIAGGANDALFNQAFFNIDVFANAGISITEYIMPAGVVDDITTQMNAVVELNGLRVRPPESARYVGDDVTTEFNLPVNGDVGNDGSGSVQVGVADTEVIVLIDGVQLLLGIDYTLSDPVDFALFNFATFGNTFFYDPASAISRYVILTNPPADGTKVEVYVTTESGYYFSGDELIFKNSVTIVPDDQIVVTTYNDTSELDLMTEVFLGPTVVAESESDSFDQAPFDIVSFDQLAGIDVNVNLFLMQRTTKINPNRLWVTLNGERLNSGGEYTIVDDNVLQIFGPIIQPEDVLAVTSMTDNVVMNGVAYRLFKDMRDNTAMYKINETVETYLTQELLATDDVIYVDDATKLGQPKLSRGQFGIVIINGERITYRVRDLNTNSLSGLRRGTAGTGANDHAINSLAHDIGPNALVPWDYDQIWYASDGVTASNGVTLQDQTTIPALFIKN